MSEISSTPSGMAYPSPMKSYTFACIRAGEPGPAVHVETCADDDAALGRALSLFELWPLAVTVAITQGERSFEVARPS